jgi:hypothetical protein
LTESITGNASILTVPVIEDPVHVIPNAVSSGVTVTVYEPGTFPPTVILAVVDDPERPAGSDHTYTFALDTPTADTTPELADEQ